MGVGWVGGRLCQRHIKVGKTQISRDEEPQCDKSQSWRRAAHAARKLVAGAGLILKAAETLAG